MAIRMQVHGVHVEADTVAEAVEVIKGLASDTIAGAGGETRVQVFHRTEPAPGSTADRQAGRQAGRQAVRTPQPVRAPASRAATATTPKPDELAEGVMKCLRGNPKGRKALAERFSVSLGRMQNVLNTLAADGRIYSTGVRRSQLWNVGPPAKEAV